MPVTADDPNWNILHTALVHHRQVTFHYVDSKKVEKYRKGFVHELSTTHVRILDCDKDGVRDCVLASIVGNVLFLYPRDFPEKPPHRAMVPARPAKNTRR